MKWLKRLGVVLVALVFLVGVGWTFRVQLLMTIAIDKTLEDPESPDDEYIYWQN